MAEVLLSDHVERFIPGHELGSALKQLPRREFRRREIAVRPGERAPLLYVESGLLRLSGTNANARERTYQFALEGWWLTDWRGFEGPGAEFEIQAVEPTRVVALERSVYEELLRSHPALESYFRQVFQRAWAAGQRRLMLHGESGAAEMYEAFVRRYPDFVQRVPQYMLASFLGFSPEFLSRLRARS